MSDAPLIQLSYPTSQGCAFVLRSMSSGNDAAKAAAPSTSCRDVSVSDQLKFRAVMRDTVGAYIFEVETPTLAMCATFIVDVQRQSKGIEVVSDCKQK